ncbi:recombination protein RecA [Anaerovirgula multivorans]|uniref:Protein RecA n=1 Tax=Anaerovirgula multivorans TaxID=312168 RepID=A0A239CN45_9FIRM|nr:hypothetical protein [Anaerovirgula multivorans]SNS20914.1 recombination protein RecA [Anaerovirgula multivorans]
MSDIVQAFRKEFGETSIFRLGEGRLADIEVRSSGSLMLDLALGGGWAKGRLVLLSGPEKSGKSSVACLAIAEAQQAEPEKENAVIDLENSFNPKWAETLGVDTSKLLVSQPDCPAEKVYDMIEYMLKSGRFAYIVLDSADGLVPKDELEETDWEKESRVGGTSKLNAKAMRKLINSGVLAKSGTTLIIIQQLRDKIGGFSAYGTPTVTGGGRSIKHASTTTVEVSIGDLFKKGTGFSAKYFGQQIRTKVTKNKIAPPFRTATVDVYYDEGVDRVSELVAVAKEINVLHGTSWLTLMNPITGEVMQEDGKDLKWNGTTKAREAIMDSIENGGGELYTKILDIVNEVIRG